MNKYLVLLVAVILLLVMGTFSLKTPETVTPTVIASVDYSCNAGKTVAATFYAGEEVVATSTSAMPIPTGTVSVTLSDGRTMSLKQTISADGVRYANADESFIFWSKGRGAVILENNQQTFMGCIELAKDPGGLSAFYSNGSLGFSIRLPAVANASSTLATTSDAYLVNEPYKYQALGPGKDIGGVKFMIPQTFVAGTNLSSDSGISVEEIAQSGGSCSAGSFLDGGASVATTTDGATTYSVASSTDAAAGNRYEETVYALPGTNPCVAVRYFIHYGVFENYPAGTVKEFDRAKILAQFDAIRRTLVVLPTF
jgi:membrane-bound inhibitor of C-type lysozyme